MDDGRWTTDERQKTVICRLRSIPRSIRQNKKADTLCVRFFIWIFRDLGGISYDH